MAIITGVCMVLAVLIPERYQEHPRLRSFGVFASLTLLGVQLTRAVSGGDFLQLSVEFAAALIIGVLDFALKKYFPQGGTVFIYGLTILLLLWRPQGLFARASGK